MKNTHKLRYLGMMLGIVTFSLLFGTRVDAQTTSVKTWNDLKNAIEGLKANEKAAFVLADNMTATSQITVTNGKQVTITCEKAIKVERGNDFTDDFFEVKGTNASLSLSGKDGDNRLCFDGKNYNVYGSFIGVRDSAILHIMKNTTVKDFYSTLDAGAIYNDSKTIIYKDSIFTGNKTDSLGNAIFNTRNGYLQIRGCNISGSGNKKADIFQGGRMEFKEESNGTAYVKIENGIDIRVEGQTTITSNFKLLDSRCPIRIDASMGSSNNNILISVDSSVNGAGASQVKNCFYAGSGYENQELIVKKNKFYRGYSLKYSSIDQEAYIVMVGAEEPTKVVGSYGSDEDEDMDSLITDYKWTSSNTNCLKIVSTSNKYCVIQGIKHTGYQNPVTLTYTLTNGYTTLTKKVKVYVEKQPQITIDDMIVGKEAVLNAPLYTDQYKGVSYHWLISKDCGKTWKVATEGSGSSTSCYTTVKLDSASEDWRFRCNVFLSYGDGFFEHELLRSNIISLASLNKKIPSLSLSDKKAVYTGNAISVESATVTPRTLQGYVTYTYYTNSLCTVKTTSKNGATKVGGPPKNVGTYYVVAELKETERYRSARYAFALLKITKAKGEVAVNKKTYKITMGNTASVALTKNFGNSKYTVKVSKPKLLKVEVVNGAIRCTPLKPGKCTVTINTTGNNNVTATTTSFNVQTQLEKIKIKKASFKGKKLSVQTSIAKCATEYQIQVSVDPKFQGKDAYNTYNIKKSKYKKKKGKTTFTFEKWNKKYYIRVRVIYGKGKSKSYGKWSKVKKITRK